MEDKVGNCPTLTHPPVSHLLPHEANAARHQAVSCPSLSLQGSDVSLPGRLTIFFHHFIAFVLVARIVLV